MDSSQATASLAVFGILFAVNSDAAIGAAFGAAFFLMSATHFVLHLRTIYTAVSAVFGYGVGIGIGGDWAMLSAVLGSASAVVTLETLLHGREPSPFMNWLLDVIRGRR
jgi:hypothetical protein